VPLMPISLFRSRAFNGANIYTFLLYAVLGGGIYFVTIDLQAVHAYTPIAAGAAMLPFITIIFVLSRWSGGLSGSIGPKIPLIAGAIIVGLAFVALASTVPMRRHSCPPRSYWDSVGYSSLHR
jgi:hypothetical protein